jgi:transposase
LIASITGISKYIAKVIYSSFAHKDFISKNSMYAFIWYDPKLRDSWNMQGKARITKRWNPYTRKKLFQAAFMSTLHSKYFKSIYDRAKDKWKHHFTSVISVIKKMVHIIFSLLKNKTSFKVNFGQF